ncbi:DNA polymerase III delta prime subunit [Breoghania corrubedonensis]|uniref:DNA polymerase III delta prime subunit n=1 Tax=Breoghania corrubedonensis TaxID=665038 RepID=A0A2T5V901_9HYPH|nr:DNA polymerase III subunit delta' [Breoghania corrubedonensis]PTW60235.1 DNA polymerase III delta prime subunit [Breoghania corrubedonensis]
MASGDTDTYPEFDRIEGLPLPREQMRLIGHREAETMLLEAYRTDRLHHAWLIGGPKGIGKATLAFRMARFVLSHPDRDAPQLALAADLSVDPTDQSVRRILAGSHGDLLHLRRPWDEKAKRFKSFLTVDEVRRTVSFFGSTSSYGGWRVCIVDAADDMNASAANALLKILEEPPQKCLFFVLSHSPGRLLPTIRSRCRRLDLKPLSPQEISRGLEMFDRAGGDAAQAADLADGSLRRAIQLLDAGGIEVANGLDRLIAALPDPDLRQIHRFADAISDRKAEESYRIFLDLLRDWLDRRVHEDAAAGVPPARLVRWSEVWEKTNRAATLADALNLDRKQVVLGAFQALGEAASGIHAA